MNSVRLRPAAVQVWEVRAMYWSWIDKDASLEVYMLTLKKPLLELVSYGLQLCPGLLPFQLQF